MVIIESKLHEQCPELSDRQLRVIADHTYWGFYVEHAKNPVPLAVAEQWYVYICADEYSILLPRGEEPNPTDIGEQVDKLVNNSEIPSWSPVYVVPVRRGAYTTREARKLYEMRQSFLLNADLHYEDCGQDVFVWWKPKDLVKSLLDIVGRQLQVIKS